MKFKPLVAGGLLAIVAAVLVVFGSRSSASASASATVVVETNTTTISGPANTSVSGYVDTYCPSGYAVTGGGEYVDVTSGDSGFADTEFVQFSHPIEDSGTYDRWESLVRGTPSTNSFSVDGATLTVYAICTS